MARAALAKFMMVATMRMLVDSDGRLRLSRSVNTLSWRLRSLLSVNGRG
ncbi:hypothetical protein [Sphingobium sp. Z007]|nr:hypothetical protein [Sphingobium sp. Z007]